MQFFYALKYLGAVGFQPFEKLGLTRTEDIFRIKSGVVKQCFYYDRSYLRSDIKVTPPSLISCFFPYTREGILNLVNNEICCNFTHIIITDGTEGIDLDSNTTPICGSI